ncbi:hypothetical protein EVAR_23924_1 [Eumeta japonica]|uniref:Uncharacterized protein n=1 Tax=Eumeta variegata TaxID=151549 RepID=A0A4C1V2S3_EUMVA|nr:hypothetical protein EVAR_23924_1 [Eumeta japonica]
MLIVVSPNIYASGLTCSSAAAVEKLLYQQKRTTCRDAVRIGLRLSPERNLGSGLEFEADGRRMKSKSRAQLESKTMETRDAARLIWARPLLNQPTSNCAHVVAFVIIWFYVPIGGAGLTFGIAFLSGRALVDSRSRQTFLLTRFVHSVNMPAILFI